MDSRPHTPLRLLVAEDSDVDFAILLRELRNGGFDVTAERVASAATLHAALDRPWDMIVSDWMIPSLGGAEVLAMIAQRKIETPCIVLSGTAGEEPAVAALRAGALDFLSKDRPRRIVPAIERALREAALSRAQKRAAEELRFSELRYRAGFDIAPELLLTYDLENYKFVDANARALEFFQWTREELFARGLGGFSPEAQPDGRASTVAAQEYVARARTGETISFEWVYLIQGELVPAEITFVHLPTPGANLARVSILDLRERRQAEEMRQRAAELEQQNRRFQEANRLKSEFLANMSHELRTPLNAIIGFAELLHDGAVPANEPQHREFLGDILSSGRHLLQLINDVLDLAKVEAGKLEFRPEHVRLDRLVDEVTAVSRTVAATKRLRVELDVDPACNDVFLDPARFKQVVYNYLSNALKFTPDGGRIVLRIRPDGDRFRLEVIDTGIGVAGDQLHRLFVEFQQLESGSTKRHQGTGLGLALTKRLVEAQGGTVAVSSRLGAGSTFSAVLPRRVEILVEPARPRTVTSSRHQTVLVVEDDARDQAQLVAALANAGYAVETASTGQEALELWRTRKFDAATIDLLLPDMSGVELLQALGREGGTGGAPVIIVTVIPDARVVAGYAVHDVLSKPFDDKRLIASLVRAGVSGTPGARDGG